MKAKDYYNYTRSVEFKNWTPEMVFFFAEEYAKEVVSEKSLDISNCDLECSPETRKVNSLLYELKQMFDKFDLTSFNYYTFLKLVRNYCKNNNCYYDADKNLIYEKVIKCAESSVIEKQ